MGLKDLKISKEVITLPDGEFTVRGLSLPDILHLADKYFPVMEKMFEQFVGQDTIDLKGEPARNVASLLMQEAPMAIAEIIAMAADALDDEGIAIAKVLPFPTQIEALDKIGKLTFKSEADLGNVVAAVINVLKASGRAVHQLHQSA